MRTSRTVLALTLVFGVTSAAGAQPAVPPAPAAPVVPAPAAPVAPVAPAAPAAPAAPSTPAVPVAPRAAASLPQAEEVRQGVARLERGGRLLGFGAVLRSDGRILSALSALGHGNFVEARFADDSVLPVRVVHSDRAWDLALLAPDGGHWALGLRPSSMETPAPGATLHRFRGRGGRLEAATLTVTSRATLLGRDGANLDDALVLSSRIDEDELGTPLLDDRGEVAAIAIQACAPAPGANNCQLSTFGAPVSALRQFLRKAPPREPLPAAAIGFRGVAAHDGAIAGVRVVSVEANGPAARAGLRGEAARAGSNARGSNGDLIVAVEDAPVATPEELRDAINRFALSPAPGTKPEPANSGERRVRLLVFGSGKFREVSLPLRAPRQLPAAPASSTPAPTRPTPAVPAPGRPGNAPASNTPAAPAPKAPVPNTPPPTGAALDPTGTEHPLPKADGMASAGVAVTAPSAPADKGPAAPAPK